MRIEVVAIAFRDRFEFVNKQLYIGFDYVSLLVISSEANFYILSFPLGSIIGLLFLSPTGAILLTPTSFLLNLLSLI